MKSLRARAPSASSPVVRRIMQANTPVDTSPELLLRSALHRVGLRFRKDVLPLRWLKCKADVVFPRAKVCVFVDGCFWHGCPRHFRAPRTNRAWWTEKIADNQRRDRQKRRQLRQHGWTVIRFWEHQITPETLQPLVDRVLRAVRMA